MSFSRAVVYIEPGKVEVQTIAYPKFEDPKGRKINHAVILKILSTNICGSDQQSARRDRQIAIAKGMQRAAQSGGALPFQASLSACQAR